MNDLQRRLGRVEEAAKAAREARVTLALQMIGTRIAAGDEEMGQALDRVAETTNQADGLAALDVVLGLLDEDDPAVRERLEQEFAKVRCMTDEQLLAFLAQRGRR